MNVYLLLQSFAERSRTHSEAVHEIKFDGIYLSKIHCIVITHSTSALQSFRPSKSIVIIHAGNCHMYRQTALKGCFSQQIVKARFTHNILIDTNVFKQFQEESNRVILQYQGKIN